MAKTKNKKKKIQQGIIGANGAQIPGTMTLHNYAQTVFNKRAAQFQKSGSSIDSVYEGLDLDAVRMKRRISSVLSMSEEIKSRFSAVCPDSPNTFSLAEDWVIMNSYPVSAFDHVEKYVFSTLGAAIWILDNIRDNGKTDLLNEILSNVSPVQDVSIPDVWDPCHSIQLLRQMVSIINNRHADCPITEKAIRKNKASVVRVYMDRPTAENKIDHTVPSRQVYDQIIALIDPNALSSIESVYEEKHWEWLHRYFQCRAIFNAEEQKIRAEIQEFQNEMRDLTAQTTSLSQSRKQFSILSTANTPGTFSVLNDQPNTDQLMKFRTLEYKNRILFEKQEEFNLRFNAFTREVGEFPLTSKDAIAAKYGENIARIWEGFELEDPYSMCMAFLSLLDRNSDLPWCYFPSVILQSFYVSMLPWTRTRYIPSCDDIWEHYDAETGNIIPGPSTQPLSKKIKVPDMDNWYRMQFHDTAKSNPDDNNLFSLSHIMYEVTGCLMPRKPTRHLSALSTLKRYGINSKKANQNLLYCMSLLGEAKHQTMVTQFNPAIVQSISKDIPDTVDELREQVIALREELAQCRQALQETANKSAAGTTQISQLQRELSNRDYLIHDLSNIVFDSKLPTVRNADGFPHRTASNFIVFSSDESWSSSMANKLPDVQFLLELPKRNTAALRNADMIWIQPKAMSYDKYRHLIIEARKSNLPVRIFPFTDVISCAVLLVQTDISR